MQYGGNRMPESAFSYWIRQNLKSATEGLIAQDIDFVLMLESKLYIVEEKNSKRAKLSLPQKVIYKMLEEFFQHTPSFGGIRIIHREHPLESEHECSKLLSDIRNQSYNIELGEDEKRILWDCKGAPKTKHTREESSFYRGSNIENCFKNLNIYYQKIDWIFVNYCTGFFMFLEELSNNRRLSHEKCAFIHGVDKYFRKISKKVIVKNPKSLAKYRYFGYNILEMDSSNPEESGCIKFNGHAVGKEELKEILNLDNQDILLDYSYSGQSFSL